MNSSTFMVWHGADPTGSPPDRRVRVGPRSGALALATGHARLAIVAAAFTAGFAVIGLRLADLAVHPGGNASAASAQRPAVVRERAELTDRNGELLAANLELASLYANPRLVLDAGAAAEALARALPDLSQAKILGKLSPGRSFVWLKRHLTPREQAAVIGLGIPGFAFRSEQRRVYPMGALTAHVVGFADVDNRGLGGIEQALDAQLRAPASGAAVAPVRLSLDVRVQHVLRGELAAAITEFDAAGAAGIVMDAVTGEVIALSSLPDFDPNLVAGSTDDARFNRATLGVYEPGSTLKTLTMAMALEYGTATLDDRFDATKPLRMARFTIRDAHPQARWLSMPEIFIYSSNIGAARMAMDIGAQRQRAFLARLGLLDRPAIEFAEVGSPLTPEPWRDINAATVAFGYGIAVSPLQLTAAFASAVNGGIRVSPTFIARNSAPVAERVLSEKTSETLRRLLRLNVVAGTGRLAEAAGYLLGGKTGTTEKAVGGLYHESAVISTFIGAFPIHAPRYVVYAMLDEPKGTLETQGFATAGWTVAPAVARIVARIAPLLDVLPVDESAEETRQALFISLDGRRNPGAAL